MKSDQRKLVETLSKIYQHNPAKLASILEDLCVAGEISEELVSNFTLCDLPNTNRARLVEGCGGSSSSDGCGSRSSYSKSKPAKKIYGGCGSDSESDGCGSGGGCDSPVKSTKRSSDGCGSSSNDHC